MASVMLGDLDDFIAPGQACINPLFTTPEDVKAAGAAAESENRDLGKASMQLVLEDDGGPVDAMMVSQIYRAIEHLTFLEPFSYQSWGWRHPGICRCCNGAVECCQY